MKELIGAGVVASWFLFGCAGTQVVHPGTASASASAARGSILTHGRAVKAIVAGPTVVHAYTADAGGDIYTAPAITGSDQDCAMAAPDPGRRAVRIGVDHRVDLTVAPGQIACLETSNPRNFELLWHAHNDGRPVLPEPRIAVAVGAVR